MDILWQHNNPANPSDAAIGPQAYDHHLYYRLVQVSSSLCVICSETDIYSLLAVVLVYVNKNSILSVPSHRRFSDRASQLRILKFT